ncbi:MAG: hypothetical protein KGJ59_13560, partial [Bacteroidota bacterium]|nr:hypothetical protein [Bacteroidota bacterium]
MIVKEAQVLYDARGKKSHVLLPYKKYEKMLELLENALDAKAMDEVKDEKTIPWEEV